METRKIIYTSPTSERIDKLTKEKQDELMSV